MQKWEYGFFNIREESEKLPGKLVSRNYRAAYLNEKQIARFDPYTQPPGELGNLEKKAFNILGSMGWELVSYTYHSDNISSSKIIVFKRPIEEA